jgi:sec-independent protein translocase protein TatA
MPSFGPMELVIILVIIIIIFGARRLPELGGALGKSIKEFRQSTAELREPSTEPATPQMERISVAGGGTTVQRDATATKTNVCPQCSSSNACNYPHEWRKKGIQPFTKNL